MRQALLLLAVLACGSRGASEPARRDDAAPVTKVAHGDARQLELPALELGEKDFAAFGWRKRAGQVAYKLARTSEFADRWADVAKHCAKAIEHDPTHLEAQWLYAVALAKIDKANEVLAPLTRAVAGDFVKWSVASLEQPALAAFLATPTGAAWQRRIESDRARLVAALAHATIVTAGGDLYAVTSDRWYRLTHTFGGVIAALPSPDGKRYAYVVRRKARGVAVGIVDLSRAYASHPFEPGGASVRVAWAKDGAWVGSTTAHTLDDDGHPHALPAKSARPPGVWLEVGASGARVHRLPVAGVTADWDDRQLASAIRANNHVITVPSPGVIDGNTLVWSPDRANLAFVALLDDTCTPTGGDRTAVFVADATTGAARELARGSRGLAVEWLGTSSLAIARDRGVSIVELAGASTKEIDGATGLATPRKQPRCIPETIEEPPPDDDPADAPRP